MTQAHQILIQDSFPGMGGLEEAVEALRIAGVEERGAVFTRREVVEFILDLSKYDVRENLAEHRLLEPSFGSGNFLLPAIERLLDSFLVRGGALAEAGSLSDCIQAVELHSDSFNEISTKVRDLLLGRGIAATDADVLVDAWLLNDDFLLSKLPANFNHVIGNPPYIRQEKIPDILLAEYRARFSTIFDRADLYVPFIERSLRLLAPGGTSAFICSDRWMKNRYGAPLRKLVSTGFCLKAFVDMVNTPAFESDVIAYPAIAVMTREEPGPVRVTIRPKIESQELVRLAGELRGDTPPREKVVEMAEVVQGDAPWLFEGVDKLALVRRLEQNFTTLEEAGCRVGIGVATGADKVFVAPHDSLDIESDRKLPLVMTRDILGGEVDWKGLSLVNPFDDDGCLVALKDFPKLAAYFEKHRDVVGTRHVAQKSQRSWYRTIDKVSPSLARQPKLLIPDIKGSAAIVYEEGKYYPHHNLYYIVSNSWNLRALQLVLSSGIAHLFVSLYSTRMRGGYLRFQAQYLRRIRLPRWETLSPEIQKELSRAADQSPEAVRSLLASLYSLTPEEVAVLEELQAKCPSTSATIKKEPAKP
ncbi:MAG: TaqI-like C-terminal specificity domain-containing protein [Opitutales bacterium]